MTHPRFFERAELIELREQLRTLQAGGGGGTSSGMETRVTRLETHMEYVQRDLAEIKDTLGQVAGRLSELPTRNDLWAWKWQWTALAFAVVAIVIGGIIGGLAWVQPAAQAPAAPIIVQVPAQAAGQPR